MKKGLVALAVLMACKRPPPHETTTASAPAPPAVTTTAVASAPLLGSSASAAPFAPPKDAREAVQRWNAALDAHDLDALARLYGKTVDYYGAHVDRAAVLARLRAALAADPSFHQDVTVTFEGGGFEPARPWVLFEKKTHGAIVDAYTMVDDANAIVVESDRPTDESLVRTGKCFDYSRGATLTGRLDATQFVLGQATYDGHELTVDRPVCTLHTSFDMKGAERGGPGGMEHPQAPRLDSSQISLLPSGDSDIPSALVGKHVVVSGTFEEHATQDHVEEHFRVATIAAR